VGLSLCVPWWTLPIALIGACFLAGRQHDCRAKGTAVTLLANWCACTAVVNWTHDEYPVVWFATFDYAAALVIVLLVPLGRRNRTRWQTSIGLLYACEFIVHGFVAWIEMYRPDEVRAARYYGYDAIYLFAWMQALVILTWGGRGYLHRHRVRRRVMAYYQHLPAPARSRR